MPSLQVLKGPNEGQVIPLADVERHFMGRDPECQIHIPVTSVSRKHATIVKAGGKFFIEDNNSRNGTYVNNAKIEARTQLKDKDRIRICDFITAFLDGAPGATAAAAALMDDDGPDNGPGTVEATLSHTSQQLLETQPAEKLRLLIDITNNLSKILELQSLLPKIGDSLFQLFKQADRCFIIMADGDKLLPRVVKTRRAADEASARFSRSIVRKCISEATALLFDDASRDDRIQLSQSVVDFRIRSVMCAPLVNAQGKAFGVIQLDTQDRGKKFKEEDLKLLCGVANQASISLENARMLDETVKQEGIKRDLALAKRIQGSFLPSGAPKFAGYEFFGFYEAAKDVGGDYYGYVPLPGGKLCVAVGDVAGKGVPASLIMAKLSSDIRVCLLTEDGLGPAVSKLNNMLYEFVSPLDRFVTLGAIVIDPNGHKVTLASAGHPVPLIWRPSTGEVIDSAPPRFGNQPLGMMDDVEFETHEFALQAGDALVLYSDGCDESMNKEEKTFGVERIKEVIRAAGDVPAPVLGQKLVDAVHAHAVGRDPHDDLTVVVLRRVV